MVILSYYTKKKLTVVSTSIITLALSYHYCFLKIYLDVSKWKTVENASVNNKEVRNFRETTICANGHSLLRSSNCGKVEASELQFPNWGERITAVQNTACAASIHIGSWYQTQHPSIGNI